MCNVLCLVHESQVRSRSRAPPSYPSPCVLSPTQARNSGLSDAACNLIISLILSSACGVESGLEPLPHVSIIWPCCDRACKGSSCGRCVAIYICPPAAHHLPPWCDMRHSNHGEESGSTRVYPSLEKRTDMGDFSPPPYQLLSEAIIFWSVATVLYIGRM
ncbi:hypothetical protein BO99DRAFT_19356 [Aspergillus violaceofuscus CBS 115571]|uniref:Uncharacterized protein n=1 Tax=Aspergillus violaceofuscus (strain CBS 115571) TaxID=1450538 RepID=A0A2V5HD68_ASPV1|nr:hypothetical protein BO99DRAFT_19356 [Aspergillus violaceofuscus CBS 115571]